MQNRWKITHFYFMGSFCSKSLLNITQKFADEILSFRRKLRLFRKFQVTSPVHNLYGQKRIKWIRLYFVELHEYFVCQSKQIS